MKGSEIYQLSVELSDKELKGKHLTTDNFFNVLCLKKECQSQLEFIYNAEQELAKEFKADLVTDENDPNKGHFHCDDKVFFTKLSELQAKDHEIKKLNFISKDEFKKWAEDVSIEKAFFLSEHLLIKTTDGK